MTKRRLYAGSLLLLIATAPWPFWGQDTRVILGVPPWAAYSLGVTALYAGLVGYWLHRYWELSATGPEHETTGGGDTPITKTERG